MWSFLCRPCAHVCCCLHKDEEIHDRAISPIQKIFLIGRDKSSSEREDMPSAAGCTNCCTKYTLFNKEYGCPLCHLSYCKKCLSRKANIPGKTTEPVPVCVQCYNKLQTPTTKGSPLGSVNLRSQCPPNHSNHPSSSHYGSGGGGSGGMTNAIHYPNLGEAKPQMGQPKNWWGEGLPPPSMRAHTNPAPWRGVDMVPRSTVAGGPSREVDPETAQMEQRFQQLRKVDPLPSTQPLSLEQIEERLAALRGCDVELVRNPRSWFASASDEVPMAADTVDGLLAMAEDRARIERRDVDEIEERYERLKAMKEDEKREEGVERGTDDGEPTEEPENDKDPRLSVISQDTAFSTATKEELRQIKEMMSDAERRLQNAHPTDKELDTEMKHVLAETRQKSIDIQKVNDQLENFYGRRLDKVETEEDSDAESLDDETLRRIMEEAERQEDEETRRECGSKGGSRETESGQEHSKGPGFLGRIFKK